MIRRVLKRIGLALIAAGGEDDPPPRAGKVSKTNNQAFDRQAERLLKDRPDPAAAIPAGALQLLGLKEVQDELGEAWESVAAKAHEIVEKALLDHLTDVDIFTRRDDETYILCFGALNRLEAEQKTRQMVEEIKAELLRQVPEANRLRVGHRIAEVSPDATCDGASFLDAIVGSLDEVRREAEEISQRHRRNLLENAAIVFSPVWNPQRQSILLYRCLLDDWTSQTTLQSLAAMTNPDDLQNAVSELDCLMLTRAIRAIHQIVSEGGKTVLMVPVHFQTLNQKRQRDAFVSVCEKTPEPYRKLLLFEVYGIPPRAPVCRILEVLRYVRRHCHGIVLSLVAADDAKLPELKSNGVYGVSVSIEDFRDQAQDRLAGFAGNAKASTLRAFLYGVNTISRAKWSLEAGFDFVDGEAIASKLQAPKGVQRWRPPALLEHLAERKGKLSVQGKDSSATAAPALKEAIAVVPASA